MDKVTDISPMMGCDPEFFFKFEGQTVGAETFIPKGGIVYKNPAATEISRFIIDGVQAELNPRPNTCRANLANEIRACFALLNAELTKRGKGFTLDFSRTVEISKEKLMELDEKSRVFGCAPSKSIYKKLAGLKINNVDPTEYRVRAAGGHIHIGYSGQTEALHRALTREAAKTVEMLDILCGNTAVLIDRDAGNIERRKVYGKAGEYRLPKHGLEYRTLSNFWLTSYPLMSFAFGMARLAVQLMGDTPKKSDIYYKEFTSKVKTKNIHNAINNNDFDLAMENFKAIEKLILEVAHNNERYAIHANNITEFHHFVKMIQAQGLNYWFKQDPLEHWTTVGECHRGGFHDYLLDVVHTDMAVSAVRKAA